MGGLGEGDLTLHLIDCAWLRVGFTVCSLTYVFYSWSA